MGFWLAERRTVQEAGFTRRFSPELWTVNFPRPMMASVVTTAPDALRVDAVFYGPDELAGLIWEAQDRHDHVLLGYETARDFRGCRLRFRWRSTGVLPLDAVHGPTLTIEGRDAEGRARAWYVRLWNYAEGAPEDAVVSIDFADLDGGFMLPGEADPVWAGDVDRMFVSLAPPGYGDGGGRFAMPVEAWVELTGIDCDGPVAVIAQGDVLVPPHGLSMATGYDDLYHLTPARVVRTIVGLGYRGAVNHYVGMSHYFRLDGAGMVTTAGGALNEPCRRWHEGFADACRAAGLGLILSLSYELFDAHCPEDWKQRASDGSPALTGWVPPSTLLSPANGGAMAYLQHVARAFVRIARDAGLAVRFQVGEPWWWVTFDRRLCLYDAAARVALGDPPAIDDVRAPMSARQVAALDGAGALLAASTAALVAAVREVALASESLLLVYLPTVLDEAAPEVKRANVPVGWAKPAFDVLQLEDYDWVTTGNRGATARGVAVATARLGYPISEQHYLSGFVLRPEERVQWGEIAAAAAAARARGVAETFVWALPQVMRDGFTAFDEGEGEVTPFDDVTFPLEVGREAVVRPAFSTMIATGGGGHEQRAVAWADARMEYDAGPGVRSEADLVALIAFFRARRGAARGFRFRDPFDADAKDVRLGAGDGIATRFGLVKRYGGGDEAQVRRITRPVSGSVTVTVDGVPAGGWSVEPGGTVAFAVAPAAGAVVRASFRFDVPVRFAEDRVEVSRSGFLAGEAASVPLVEVREG